MLSLVDPTQTIFFQPLLLTGHHGEISAMAFGQGSRPVLLCSASADYIIVWDIRQCQRKTQEGQKIVNNLNCCSVFLVACIDLTQKLVMDTVHCALALILPRI